MAKKPAADKAATTPEGAIRELVAANPTWPDHRVHGALRDAGVEVSRGEVADVRARMGAKHEWKD